MLGPDITFLLSSRKQGLPSWRSLFFLIFSCLLSQSSTNTSAFNLNSCVVVGMRLHAMTSSTQRAVEAFLSNEIEFSATARPMAPVNNCASKGRTMVHTLHPSLHQCMACRTATHMLSACTQMSPQQKCACMDGRLYDQDHTSLGFTTCLIPWRVIHIEPPEPECRNS